MRAPRKYKTHRVKYIYGGNGKPEPSQEREKSWKAFKAKL